MYGKLFIVSIPIGNLQDGSQRMSSVLAAVEYVAAEDTRRAGIFLSNLGLKKKLISYHDHNEKDRANQILEILKQGQDIALISDAGTPTISDPGYRIVSLCRFELPEVKIISIPGACAAIAALSISGLPTDRFIFEGFLPPKGNKRTERIKTILASNCTSVIYESTYKITRLLDELAALEPTRRIFIAREITKTYEENLFGTAAQLSEIVKQRKGLKGEMVVVVDKSVAV